ncbi:MAG: T9SS type A sorting domain-containing protein, partial [candidate division WOR-3 bacterium]|nr:T9SS type A sorting domain-containing protein [candidate division WOR-3 bacterium]
KRVGKGAALCYDGDSIIYATKGNSTLEFWAYNINQNKWTFKNFLPLTLRSLKGGTSMVFYGGKVYLLAGGQKYDYDNFFCYNPATNQWNALAKALFTPDNKPFKDGSCLAVLYDTIYALKGSGKDNYFYAYDVNTNTWYQRTPIPLIHPQLNQKNKVKNGGAMVSNGQTIYAIKGGGKQDFWIYQNCNWIPLCTIPRFEDKNSVPKAGAALAYANNAIWLLKGNNTNYFLKYIPSADKNYYNSGFNIQTSTLVNSFLKNSLIEIIPNPCSRNATIHYIVLTPGIVSLRIYNSSGQLITTISNNYHNSGYYSVEIDNQKLNMRPGIYFINYESFLNNFKTKLIVQ